jgi:SAM-dependent methyltransferase
VRPLERVAGAELMDRPDVEPRALAQGLADLRRVNRWLGGTRAALQAVLPLVREVAAGGEVRVLDVATGSADIPCALVRRARRDSVPLRVTATDLHPATVAAARLNVRVEPAIEVAQADGLALELEDGAFDVAMCHTALHHFSPADAVRLLAEMARVASYAVVVTDLSRSRAAVAAVGLLSHTLWRRHPVTHHDSMVSIRSAYTGEEARAIAQRSGLPAPMLRRHPFFRFSLLSRLKSSPR